MITMVILSRLVPPLFLLLLSVFILQSIDGSADDYQYDFVLDNVDEVVRWPSVTFLSPDNETLCFINSTSVVLYNISRAEVVLNRTFDNVSLRSGCWIDDRILVAQYPKSLDLPAPADLLVLSPVNLSTMEEVVLSSNYPAMMQRSPDGRYIAATVKKELYVYNAFDYSEAYHSTDHTWNINALAWKPDGRMLVSTGYHLYVHDIAQGTSSKVSTEQVSPSTLLWAQRGDTVYVIEHIGRLGTFDIGGGGLVEWRGIAGQIDGGAFCEGHGDICLATGPELRILSPETYEYKVFGLETTDHVSQIFWNMDGYRLITIDLNGTFQVYLDRNNVLYDGPIISIDSPLDGGEYSGDVEFTGTVSDDQQVAYAMYSLNSASWVNMSDPTAWTLNVPSSDLSEGENTIVVKASDGTRVNQVSISFTYSDAGSQGPQYLMFSLLIIIVVGIAVVLWWSRDKGK